MSQITPLSELARYAFNQLLNGTDIAEVYENLNIYALLDDAELIELEAMLDKKAGDLGLAIEGELRPRAVLEAFLAANAEHSGDRLAHSRLCRPLGVQCIYLVWCAIQVTRWRRLLPFLDC